MSNLNEDASVIQYVNQILIDAIHRGASDVHFEPFEHEFRIRYRQDGLLKAVATPPAHIATRISARLKVMSNLDISERRIPQDGRFKLLLTNTHPIDFRVSTCPTLAGEKIVVRVLDPTTTTLTIASLGFSAIQESHFLKAIERPQGLVLVTGPTGSGKTVTLYSALNHLNSIDKNICTVEDPIEIKMPGINQVNINPKAGLGFSEALRSFLRQDPDVIMVGEIRDLETADIAIKAAQTGHLVLSTLHTNSATDTLSRLMNMGIASFNIASSVSLVIAQRLVRQLCEHCKIQSETLSANHLIDLGFSDTQAKRMIPFKAIGCSHCSQGYRGRIALFELLPMSTQLSEIILSNNSHRDILNYAKESRMRSLYQSGLDKVADGTTSLEEINRIC